MKCVYAGFKTLFEWDSKQTIMSQCAMMVPVLENMEWRKEILRMKMLSWLLDLTTGSSAEYTLDARGYLLFVGFY